MPLFVFFYLPYQSDDNTGEYQDILDKIQSISDSFESANIFIIGDFNADIKKPSLFTQFFNAFINNCPLIPNDTLLLPSDAFTYVVDVLGSRSCSPPTLVTHQYLIWKLNMTVSLPTIYLYVLLYLPSYYLV